MFISDDEEENKENSMDQDVEIFPKQTPKAPEEKHVIENKIPMNFCDDIKSFNPFSTPIKREVGKIESNMNKGPKIFQLLVSYENCFKVNIRKVKNEYDQRIEVKKHQASPTLRFIDEKMNFREKVGEAKWNLAFSNNLLKIIEIKVKCWNCKKQHIIILGSNYRLASK